ncbi:MAG: hypothetical protein ACRELA_06105, partial [Candidatus Rokuibacteriota bacterium]
MCLDHPDTRGCDPDHLALLRSHLADAVIRDVADQRLIVRGERLVGIVHPFGSVTLYLPTSPSRLRHRLLDLDRGGRVTLAIRRGSAGDFRRAWLRNVDGTILALHPGEADHPLWGASDRIVRLSEDGSSLPLTVSGAVQWDAVAAIPPLADPSRLPAGAGSTILNLLAALAVDQGVDPLRYRGPYPTEQLFWALVECFRFTSEGADPVAAFIEDAEAVFAAGESHEVPLDWTPAPHERLFLDDGICVQLRDGVEKVWWEGRTYYRREWQGLLRREHRVIRTTPGPEGERRFIAGLEAGGCPLEDHLVLDPRGTVLERPAPPATGAEPEADRPLAEPWREALGELIRLDTTPLLATAIDAVWPHIEVVWGTVPRDLSAASGRTVRLSRALARAYTAALSVQAEDAGRALANRLVREVLDLVGPPVRHAAAAWL